MARVTVYLDREVDDALRDRIRGRGDLSRIVNQALRSYLNINEVRK